MKKRLLFLLLLPSLVFAQTQLGDSFIDYRNANVLDDEGDTIAVKRDNANFFDSIEVFDYINDQWVQRQDNIGFEAIIFQLSGDGNVLILSRPSFNVSEVAVYVWDGVSWNMRGSLFLFDPEGPQSAAARILVNFDGTRVFIEDGLDNIVVYDWDGSSWNLVDSIANIDVNNNIATNSEGSRLAHTIVNPTSGTISDYSIRVLEFQNNTFQQIGNDIQSPLLQLNGVGNILEFNLDGNRLAIASSTSAEFNTFAGAFVVYEFSNASWNVIGNIVTGEEAFVQLGSDIAMNNAGDRVAVGIVASDAFGLDSGETKLYELNTDTWQEIASVSGQFAGSQSGSDVDINGIGNIISIGASGTLPQVRVFEIETLSIDDFNTLNAEIYPNPSRDFLYVKYEKEAKLNIMDFNGRIIKKNMLLSPGVNKVSIETLKSGPYFIEISDGEKAYLKKFFVN